MANTVVISAFLAFSVLVVLVDVSAENENVEFGKNCEKDDDCKTEDAVCEQGDTKIDAEKICKCNSSTVHDTKSDGCLAKVTIDMPCEVTVQCKATYPSEDVECRKDIKDNKVCLCIKGKHFFDGKCYKSVDIGGDCSKEQECDWVQNAECTEGKCACEEGYTYNDDEVECSSSGIIRITSAVSILLLSIITRIIM